MDLVTIIVDDIWYDAIVKGDKTVEGKKANPKWIKSLKIGSNVIFERKSIKEQHMCQIVGLARYANLSDYLINEGLRNTLPGITTLEEGIAIYLQYSTFKEYLEHGILAIHLK